MKSWLFQASVHNCLLKLHSKLRWSWLTWLNNVINNYYCTLSDLGVLTNLIGLLCLSNLILSIYYALLDANKNKVVSINLHFEMSIKLTLNVFFLCKCSDWVLLSDPFLWIFQNIIVFKTGSLDNAIQDFLLALPLLYISQYTIIYHKVIGMKIFQGKNLETLFWQFKHPC